MTRGVVDAALMLGVIAGYDAHDDPKRNFLYRCLVDRGLSYRFSKHTVNPKRLPPWVRRESVHYEKLLLTRSLGSAAAASSLAQNRLNVTVVSRSVSNKVHIRGAL